MKASFSLSSEYGRHLGLAFQIVDDILDVEGDADDLGKTAGKDARAGKPTYPSILGLEASRRLATSPRQRDCCAADRGAPATRGSPTLPRGSSDDELSRRRLDLLLVERGLAASRERAGALVLSGVVLVNGRPAHKAGTAVAEDAELTLKQPDHPYVGRGGRQAGACARHVRHRRRRPRGARHRGVHRRVYRRASAARRGARRRARRRPRSARLGAAHDPRVRCHRASQTHERSSRRDLPSLVDIVTIDVSFISLRHIFPRVPPVLRQGADVIALVKPQFEAGRRDVGKKGVVSDPAVQERVVENAARAAAEVGLARVSDDRVSDYR